MVKYLIFLILTLVFVNCNKLYENGDRNIRKNEMLKFNLKFSFQEGKINDVWANDSLIFVSSTPKYYIYVYNLKGQLIRRIGDHGEAPWQYGCVGAFSYEEGMQHYWVQDLSKSLLKRYNSSNDSMVYYVKLNTRNSIQYIGHKQFLVFRQVKDKILFSIFNPLTNEFVKDFDLVKISNGFFSKLIPNYSDYVFTYGISNSQDNKFITANFLYVGGFVTFNTEKQDMIYNKDFRDLEFPDIGIENGFVKLKPYHILYGHSSTDSQFTYILSTKYVVKRKWNEGKEYYIDKYSNSTGQYIESLNLPIVNEETPFGIVKISGKIISYSRDGLICVYKTEI